MLINQISQNTLIEDSEKRIEGVNMIDREGNMKDERKEEEIRTKKSTL